MKKTCVFVVVVMGLWLMVGGALGIETPTAIAYKVVTKPVIDGVLSENEWNTSSPIIIAEESQVIRDANMWSGPEDCSLKLYVMWDEENLYLAADVTENTTFGATDLLLLDWEDSMKLFLSTNPQDDPDRITYSTTDFLLLLITDNMYWDTAFDRSMVEDNQRFTSKGMDGGQNVLTGYERAATTNATGYTFEAIIPWSNFSNENIPVYTPKAGDTIKFNYGITDISYACPGTEYVPQMAWTGDININTNPSLWGNLTFAE